MIYSEIYAINYYKTILLLRKEDYWKFLSCAINWSKTVCIECASGDVNIGVIVRIDFLQNCKKKINKASINWFK